MTSRSAKEVPAYRVGHQVMNVGLFKSIQEVITLMVFVPFSLFYLREKITLDYLWAGLCLLGAVFVGRCVFSVPQQAYGR